MSGPTKAELQASLEMARGIATERLNEIRIMKANIADLKREVTELEGELAREKALREEYRHQIAELRAVCIMHINRITYGPVSRTVGGDA